jgi:uncharacterized membrane protein YccC
MNVGIDGHHENPVYIYLLEILSACLICYFLYVVFPRYRLIWAMVYVAVVISPIREKSRALVFGRIKANFIGAFFGLVVLLIFRPTFLSFCVGAVATILFCHALKITATARSALLTLISVVIPQYSEPHYAVALERVICVTIGCLIALMSIIFFDRLALRLSKPARQPETQGME